MFTQDLEFVKEIQCIYKHGAFSTCGVIHQKKNGLITYIESEKYLSLLDSPYIKVIICTEGLLGKISDFRNDIGIIVSPNPKELLLKISALIKPKSFKTVIGESCCISERAIISPYNVFIGKNVFIDDGVIIKENTILRDNVRVGSGSILGCEGMMVYNSSGTKYITPHNGFLYINKDTVLLCNVLIERAVFWGDITYLGKNVILDSGASISHGCRIGDHVILGSVSKVCGHTNIGSDSYIGPGSVISNRVNIGKNCTVRIGSTLVDNLPDNSDVSSSFAINHQINLIDKMRMQKKG